MSRRIRGWENENAEANNVFNGNSDVIVFNVGVVKRKCC